MDGPNPSYTDGHGKLNGTQNQTPSYEPGKEMSRRKWEMVDVGEIFCPTIASLLDVRLHFTV